MTEQHSLAEGHHQRDATGVCRVCYRCCSRCAVDLMSSCKGSAKPAANSSDFGSTAGGDDG